jgi:cohesin complex subunit SA-1/2
MAELEDELATTLKELTNDKDNLDVCAFTEDEINSLALVCLRIRILISMRNMVSWLDETEGGKQTSVWDILLALVDRGRLGYAEEEMVSLVQCYALVIIHQYADG